MLTKLRSSFFKILVSCKPHLTELFMIQKMDSCSFQISTECVWQLLFSDQYIYSNEGQMRHVFYNEINLLCVGDILSGKSSFLQKYTNCAPERQQSHYKVYPLVSGSHLVFLHQVQERYGMDAYLSYPYDAVLYFVNINQFHNSHRAILDQLTQISKLAGINIYSIPLKVVVLSAKQSPYLGISYTEKRQFISQLEGMVKQSMIVFVEDDLQYVSELEQFYQAITKEEAPGVEESLYVSWQLKGILGLVPFDSLILNLKKVCQTLQNQWIKISKKNKIKRH